MTFEGIEDDQCWVQELVALVKTRRIKGIEAQKVNGVPTAESPVIRDMLLAGGFSLGYKGPTLRR